MSRFVVILFEISGEPMKTTDAVKHFGSQRKLAEALGLNEANVSRWMRSEIIPIKQALRLVDMTRGELELRLRDY